MSRHPSSFPKPHLTKIAPPHPYLHCPCCSSPFPDHYTLNTHLHSCLHPPDPSPTASSAREHTQQLVTDSQGETSSHHHQQGKFQDRVNLQPRVYSVFNKHRKTIHLIRHGHTTYKEGYFTTTVGNHPFDVTLSNLGIQQAIALGQRLHYLNAELILTSPLTRALQTLQHALKNSKIIEAIRIEVSGLHSEHVGNSCDVGRPPKMLAEEFPWLSFACLKDVWWHSPTNAPNDPLKRLFQSRESMDDLRKRVGVFRQFLLSRAEQTIAVIGHSTFFRELSGRRHRMQNCEILTIRV